MVIVVQHIVWWSVHSSTMHCMVVRSLLHTGSYGDCNTLYGGQFTLVQCTVWWSGHCYTLYDNHATIYYKLHGDQVAITYCMVVMSLLHNVHL